MSAASDPAADGGSGPADSAVLGGDAPSAGEAAPGGAGPSAALPAAIGLAAAALIGVGLRAIAATSLDGAGSRSATGLRSRLLHHLHRLSPGRDIEDLEGAATPLLEDVASLRDLVGRAGPRLLGAVIALVTQSYETLPQLLFALRGEGSLVADLAAIEAVADRVAAGEEAFHTAAATAAAAVWNASSPAATRSATASIAARSATRLPSPRSANSSCGSVS